MRINSDVKIVLLRHGTRSNACNSRCSTTAVNTDTHPGELTMCCRSNTQKHKSWACGRTVNQNNPQIVRHHRSPRADTDIISLDDIGNVRRHRRIGANAVFVHLNQKYDNTFENMVCWTKNKKKFYNKYQWRDLPHIRNLHQLLKGVGKRIFISNAKKMKLRSAE